MIEKGLVAYLAGDQLVSNLNGGRFYPQKSPQAKNASATTLPRVVYERGRTEKIISQDGASKTKGAHVLLHCQGATENDAKRLAAYVESSNGGVANGPGLSGFKGKLGSLTVQGCFLEDENDSFVPPIFADDVGIYEYTLEFVIWYVEPNPS